MTLGLMPPPYDAVDDRLAAARVLRERGVAVLAPDRLAAVTGAQPMALSALGPSWAHLPPDGYLRDGGHYRRRRHACYEVAGERVTAVAHRAHWQPVEYNALHGGFERWFEPVEPAISGAPAWSALIAGLGALCSAVRPTPTWFVEAHQFRIDTTGGIGRPTPEGAHRDGVDFVAVVLVSRVGVKGGETRVFDADGPAGRRFTMTQPWTTIVLDDARVIHETTPIQPVDDAGWRDTLVLTYRSDGFQGPGS